MRRLPPDARYWARLAVVAAAAVLAWFLLDRYVSPWLGAVVGFVLLAVASALLGERAPRLIELATGDAPIRAIIGDDSSVYNDGWSVALPRALGYSEQPEPGTSVLEARRYFVDIGAFDVEATSIRLAVEGRSADTVTITGIRAFVAETAPPVAQTLIRSQSAGEEKVIQLEINLDESNPVARGDGVDYFRQGFVTLVKGEVQVFQIIARAEARAYAWQLEVRYRVRESESIVCLNNSGVLFRTTPRADSFEQSYDWAWFEGPGARLIPLQIS